MVCMTRKWRGELDVPLNEAGVEQVRALGKARGRLRGEVTCFHDWLSRCRDTALAVSFRRVVSRGPRPWRMGPGFEGWPITGESIRHAQYLVEHPNVVPTGGECFYAWYDSWMNWVEWLHYANLGARCVVTHNRNIQALYATVEGKFRPELYNVDGPSYCSLHSYSNGAIRPVDDDFMPWGGVLLIRHGETDFGF